MLTPCKNDVIIFGCFLDPVVPFNLAHPVVIADMQITTTTTTTSMMMMMTTTTNA